MKLKLHSLTFVFTLGALVVINAASSLPIPLTQAATPTPTIETPTPLTGPSGDTNGIAFLGILIFAVIVAAVALRLREARRH